MKIMALRYLAIDAYKCMIGLNPNHLNNLFTIKHNTSGPKFGLSCPIVLERNHYPGRLLSFNQLLEWTNVFLFSKFWFYIDWTIPVSIILL